MLCIVRYFRRGDVVSIGAEGAGDCVGEVRRKSIVDCDLPVVELAALVWWGVVGATADGERLDEAASTRAFKRRTVLPPTKPAVDDAPAADCDRACE